MECCSYIRLDSDPKPKHNVPLPLPTHTNTHMHRQVCTDSVFAIQRKPHVIKIRMMQQPKTQQLHILNNIQLLFKHSAFLYFFSSPKVSCTDPAQNPTIPNSNTDSLSGNTLALPHNPCMDNYTWEFVCVCIHVLPSCDGHSFFFSIWRVKNYSFFEQKQGFVYWNEDSTFCRNGKMVIWWVCLSAS